MDFKGTGKRLSQGDIGDAARELGIQTAVLLAFLEVEANGRGFDSNNRPKMLFEPHVMYRNTKGTIRQKAIALGVAYKSWGALPYPRDSYPRLKTAIGVAKAPGFLSASYGLPQILGENHKAAGFSSAELMFRAMKQGEREQLLAMVSLLKDWGLAKHLKGKDFTQPESWVQAVKRYNGKGFRRNKYHIKCATAYKKHAKGDLSIASSVLVRGMKGEAVRNLQSDLDELGYDLGPIDGRFGDKTHKAVERFQKLSGLTVDGKAGSKTISAIDKALDAHEGNKAPIPPKRPDGQTASFISRLIAVIVQIITAILGAKK